jgi:Putative polyhydroxyalkanoic acid system protein (PHA_gran_rgn)
MPLIDLTVKHGRTLDDARRGLETAVHRVSAQFGTLVRRVEWTADRNRVKLEGVGFWVEMWVDPDVVHATGDIPLLAGLLGSQLGSGLKQILQQTFQKKLP